MPDYAGLIKYPTGGDIYGGGNEPQWWKDLATTTLAQITASGTYRTHTSGTFNADNAPDGTDLVHLAVTQTGTPEQGTWWITTATIADTSRMQVAVSYGAAPRVMRRFRGSGGWSGWERTDAGAIDLSALGGGGSGASPASFKTVPLALTVGGGNLGGQTSGFYRVPVRFGVTIKRWRLHLRNINPRFGTDGGTLRLGHVHFGPATAGQFATLPPRLIEGYTTLPPGGIASPWQSSPIEAGTEYAVAYSFSQGTAQGAIGGGWTASSVADPDATLTRVSSLPLDAWIEAEVEPEVPVVAAFGDSISSGVGATFPVLDSWLSQWCRANAALPVHYTASGDSMAGWDDSNHYKWQRWQHLTRPDAVIHAMGSNDVFGGATLATLKERRAKSLDQLASLVSPVIFSATVLPRNANTGAMEDTRRAYNAFVMGKPDSARAAFNFVAAVSGDDETISPGFNADGTHLNTAGYAQLGTSITAPLTAPSVTAQVQSIQDRIESALYDSGARDITALATGVTAGTIRFRVKSGWARIDFSNVQFDTANPKPFGGGGPLTPWGPVNPESGKGFATQVNTGTTYRVSVNYAGGVDVYGAPAGTVLNGHAFWPFDRTPPPTPIGDPA